MLDKEFDDNYIESEIEQWRIDQEIAKGEWMAKECPFCEKKNWIEISTRFPDLCICFNCSKTFWSDDDEGDLKDFDQKSAVGKVRGKDLN